MASLLSLMFSPWISFIPSDWIASIAPIALIIAGFLIEKHYVARPSIFLNAVALNLRLFYVPNSYWVIALYANIGIILGIIAVVSYSGKRHLPGSYYTLSYLYNSVFIGILVLLMTPINAFLIGNAPQFPIY